MRLSRGLTAAVALCALAACGTTVPSSQQAAVQQGGGTTGGNGFAPGNEPPAAGQPGSGGTTGSTTSGGTSGSGSGSGSGTTGGTGFSGGTGSTTSATGGSVSTPAGTAPGVTAATIKLGISYATDSEQGNAAVGAGGTGQGDVRNYYNALFEELNKSGGVAGRKLAASYIEANSTSGESAQAQEQAGCEHWTRDDPVFAILDAQDELLRSCAEKKNAMALNTVASNSVADTFARYRHYIEVSSIALDRHLRATVEGLSQTDYYGKAPVIGIVSWDDRAYKTAVEGTMIPALKQLGFTPKPPSYVRAPQEVNNLADSGSDVSAAVLKFRQEGVDHVFIVDGPAGVAGGTVLTLLFIRNASSQRYFPRYGMNDNNSPASGMQSGLWAPDDVRGSRVVSWTNGLDESDAGITPNQARKDCLALMKRHGMQPANLNARGFMLRACDYVWFIRDVLGRQRIDVNRDVFVARAALLGGTYRSPAAYRTFFSRTQRDGVAGLRRMALDDACGCYVYTSGIYAAPTRG